ncbi:MAG: glycosyltransferase, partial [Flavitalea sp.]
VKGWGLNDLSELEGSSDIKVISGAPYDKLMPLVKAAVHHGGIGTIAACLEAGKPFLSCPVLYPMGDQHFWGTVAFKKGVGLKPAPLGKLTETSLVNAVKKLLSDEQLYIHSKQLMERLKSENGLDNAIRYIEKSNT